MGGKKANMMMPVKAMASVARCYCVSVALDLNGKRWDRLNPLRGLRRGGASRKL